MVVKCRSGGLGLSNARSAGLVLPGVPLEFLAGRPATVVSHRETLHPATAATSIVILTQGLGFFSSVVIRFRIFTTLNVEIVTLIAYGYAAVEASLYPDPVPTQTV